jgi:predicted nucleic acid-binding protein
MAMMIADTDVLIDFLSDKNPTAARIALELEHAALQTTAVTRFELLAGARTDRQEKMIAELLAALPTLPLDAAAADRAAVVRRTLEKKGQAIGMGDSLIAGIVLVHRGTLLTRNRDHFERVPDLKLGSLTLREG